jgi:hypothetical protein
LEADALAHINETVGADFQAYAWAMAKHESRQGNRVYNQFNSGGNGQAHYERPNLGPPDGWGIAQIDRRSNRVIAGTSPPQYHPPNHPGLTPNQFTTTAEVWDWHQNINAMQAKLVEKKVGFYDRFIGYFRQSYGQQANWTEPPAQYTYQGATLPAEA